MRLQIGQCGMRIKIETCKIATADGMHMINAYEGVAQWVSFKYCGSG